MDFKRFKIKEALPQGYRLATVDEVVKYGYENIRRGKLVDVQEFGNDYFEYYCCPLDFDKTRLKDGFIDNRRKLAWVKFGGLCVVDKLAVAAPPSDFKLSSSSSATASHDDDRRVVALLYACVEEDVGEIRELIIDFGKEIMFENLHGVPCGGNALHLCAWEGKTKCLEYLLGIADKNMAAAKYLANLDGETPLLLAVLRGYVENGKAVKLLLQFDKRQINMATKQFRSTPLAMAVSWSQNKYVCEELLKEEDIQIDYKDHAGNTALHLAVQYSPLLSELNVDILQMLLRHCGLPTNGFLDGQNRIIHVWEDCIIKRIGESNQQHNRNSKLKIMGKSRRKFVNIENDNKETPLHRAVLGIYSSSLSSAPLSLPMIGLHLVSLLIWAGADINKRGMKGRTALHQACRIQRDPGSVATTIVCILQKCFGDHSDNWFKYASIADFAGETALHKAISVGNKDIVRTLLSFRSNENNEEELKEKVKKLVHERDFLGKTTLHMAVMSKPENPKDRMEIVKILLEHAGTTPEDKERFLLLWATAENIGLAEDLCRQGEYKCEELADYLRIKRLPSVKMNLLRIALQEKRQDMIVELINRDADIENPDVKEFTKDLSQIQEKYKAITSDQPSTKVFLEREAIASGIAILLLNQRTGSPVTIGIYGGTGMGKSSLMMQVNCRMLRIAAMQTLSLLKYQQPENESHDMPGGKKHADNQTSESCNNLCRKFLKLVKKYVQPPSALMDKPGKRIEGKNVKEILSIYENELSPIIKRLALRNRKENSGWKAKFKRLALGNKKKNSVPPALLTVVYNASQYEDQEEAWAALVVAIYKEMMASCMTAAHELQISWRYAFRNNPQVFATNLILPIIIIVVLGGFIGWLAWKLLSIPGSPLLEIFQYGSIPLSVLVVVWRVLDKVLRYVRPVAETLGNQYKSLSSMSENLGLQNRVIRDIQFLKNEIYKEPSFFWKCIAFFWTWLTCIFREVDGLECSQDLKCIPEKDSLRIVVFIDNLDRHKEELFMSLNPVLSACDINAVIAINKDAIGDVIERAFGASPSTASREDMKIRQRNLQLEREKFLDQLIQLPIVLPDPSVKQLRVHFLITSYNSSLPTEEGNLFDLDDDKEEGDYDDKGGDYDELFRHNCDVYYSRGEIEVLQHLLQYAIGDYRAPRKWKCLLNYHRLVRRILDHPFHSKKVNALTGWKRQLLLWVFFCWQWKEQMDGIFESWSVLVQVPEQIQSICREEDAARAFALVFPLSSPSTQRWLNFLQEAVHLGRRASKQHEKQIARSKCSREDKSKAIDEIYPSLSKIVQLRKQQKSDDPSAQEELEGMASALKRGEYDVTMSAILAFQQYRFGCKASYLPLILPPLSQD